MQSQSCFTPCATTCCTAFHTAFLQTLHTVTATLQLCCRSFYDFRGFDELFMIKITLRNIVRKSLAMDSPLMIFQLVTEV